MNGYNGNNYTNRNGCSAAAVECGTYVTVQGPTARWGEQDAAFCNEKVNKNGQMSNKSCIFPFLSYNKKEQKGGKPWIQVMRFHMTSFGIV